jgi:hypothetical protein
MNCFRRASHVDRQNSPLAFAAYAIEPALACPAARRPTSYKGVWRNRTRSE